MRGLIVLTLCGLVVVAASGQPPPTVTPAPQPDSLTLPSIAPPSISPAVAPAPPPAPPPPPTVDQLIEQLADVRAKKAELEKQEQAVTKRLVERLRDQRERLTKLGVRADAEAAPPPRARAD